MHSNLPEINSVVVAVVVFSGTIVVTTKTPIKSLNTQNH
jgi:hypothetical protein